MSPSAPVVRAAEESLYDLLGVDKTASEPEIKKAYKRAALRNHPDKAPEAQREQYEERFKKISRAYEILSDPQKRRIYDSQGEAAFQGSDAAGPAGAGGFGGFSGGFDGDPFEMFRSMFGANFGSGRRRTPDVGYAMEVSLEEIYAGCSREIRYEQDVVCVNCNGQGATRIDRCSRCGGAGATVEVRQVAPGYVTQVQRACAACGGAGFTVPPGGQCSACRGSGVLQKQVKLPVQVRPGCPNGARFSFAGKADEAPGMETGDIIVEVREKKHPAFTRVGNANLVLDRRVSLLDALCGVRFSVRHLDGSDLEIVCGEAGQVVRPGEVWVLKGRGMPHSQRPSAFGDLFVRFEVDFPKELATQRDGTSLREQLRPLIDPRAPAQAPGNANSTGKGSWFGFGGNASGGSTARSEVASRLSRDAANRLREAEERERASHSGQGWQQRGGPGNNVECAQQ